jgi:hypothetical protein
MMTRVERGPRADRVGPIVLCGSAEDAAEGDDADGERGPAQNAVS